MDSFFFKKKNPDFSDLLQRASLKINTPPKTTWMAFWMFKDLLSSARYKLITFNQTVIQM